MVDIPFINFAFPATGSSTLRTMPDRLSEIVNVKDFGAKGDNTQDDAPGIQAAIDYCLSTKANGSFGGKVFFPAGLYSINVPLNVGSSNPNARVILQGCSADGCVIRGYIDTGLIMSQGNKTYDNLQGLMDLSIINGSALQNAGGVKMTVKNSYVENCKIMGRLVGLDVSQAEGAWIANTITQTVGGPTDASDPLWFTNNSVGIYLGKGVTVSNARLQGGYFIAYAVCGDGASILGCSVEVVKIGLRVGWGPGVNYAGAEVPVAGFVVQGLQGERNDSNIELYNCRGAMIQATGSTQDAGTNNWQMGCVLVWNTVTHDVTVTTPTPHHISGAQRLQLAGPGANNYYTTTWWPDHSTPTAGTVFATPVGSNTFTYPGPSVNPGAPPPDVGWNYPAHFSFRCRKVSETTIFGDAGGGITVIAGADLDYNGEAVHRNNVYISAQGPAGWLMPSDRRNLAGWAFIQCGVPATSAYANPATVAMPSGQMNVADLPGNFDNSSGLYQPGPFEGQEYDIKDAAVVAVGATVTGGSNQHYRVRYNGTNWVRMA